jgi:hypothetical protein
MVEALEGGGLPLAHIAKEAAVMKFVEERLRRCHLEDQQAPETLRMLWSVLQVNHHSIDMIPLCQCNNIQFM